jgi:sporulation and cell division protein SsgA
MSAVIDHTVPAHLVRRDADARALSATLRYDPRDPLAVGFVFPAAVSLDGEEVAWVFSRRLLDDGLHGPSGEGDVRLRPCGTARTVLELHAPSGMARVEFPSDELRRFLELTYQAVPRDAEETAQDLERGLADLLGGV